MPDGALAERIEVVGDGPTVLMWHGRGPDDRTTLLPLAREIASRGRRVVVPDWDSTSDDLGRAELFTSLRFARESADEDPNLMTIVGWSLGGIAAASLTLHQRRLGIGFGRVVCVAAAPFPRIDPITHTMLGPPTAPVQRDTTVAFVHGLRDDLMGTEAVRETHRLWSDAGWPTSLTELDADHVTIVTHHVRSVADVVVAGA